MLALPIHVKRERERDFASLNYSLYFHSNLLNLFAHPNRNIILVPWHNMPVKDVPP